MKLSENWLREWVADLPPRDALLEQLTMLGLEVDFTTPAAPDFDGVVIGRVMSVAPHPDADKLRVCRVDAGGQTFDVVCGAPNVRVGMAAPFAPPGAALPGGRRIDAATLRGVASEGMLCSEQELGLSQDAAGLMDLGEDAPPGESLARWLALDDLVIDIDLTPNRGDCLSVRGIARDLAARNRTTLNEVDTAPVPPGCDDTFPVRLDQPDGCPRYVGRVIRGIDPGARTPRWMVEKLRRGGIRAISPTVDVTNYVMLELGQPMHAFDLGRLAGGIHVRTAHAGETLQMLDGSELELDAQTLVIADDTGAVAMAGIMGGELSGVGAGTRDIFLEAAFFAPAWISGRPRRYTLFTDSGQRFERGVDPALQVLGMERATRLLLEICGGTPGPVQVTESAQHLPVAPTVTLREAQIERLLGVPFAAAEVEDILTRLGMRVGASDGTWAVRPPSHRFDVSIEPDLIEELGRIHGYDRIPEAAPAYAPLTRPVSETDAGLEGLEDLLLARGYHEAITYSFVDEPLCGALQPDLPPLALSNPISSELAVMRTSLWPGLVGALRHNLNRQQARVRLFESGLVFVGTGESLEQSARLAGLASGPAMPQQWGESLRPVDFFDIKGEVEALLTRAGAGTARFEAAAHPALHPGQSARILLGEQEIGWLGCLHPRLEQGFELQQPAILFELRLESLRGDRRPEIEEISRFPSIRRDISVVVDESVPAQALLDTARAAAPPTLKEVLIFDNYAGKGVVSGRKSVSLGLILQDLSRTLTDHEVDDAVDRILAGIKQKLGAKLRE